MEGERIEAAVQRIEQALARIAAVADQRPLVLGTGSAAGQAISPNVLQLVTSHEALRETVLEELTRLDRLIGKLER